MALYLIRLKEGVSIGCTVFVDGFVIRADNETQARLIASDHHNSDTGNSSATAWLDHDNTSCELLDADGPPGLILRETFYG